MDRVDEAVAVETSAPKPAASDSPAVAAGYVRVVGRLRGEPAVEYSATRKFGANTLKVDGRIFALVSWDDMFVVKLP